MSKQPVGTELGREAAKYLITPKVDVSKLPDGIPVYVKGEGCHIIDDRGKRYIDMMSGGNTRVVAIGYGREEMAKVMSDQAVELHYYSPIGHSNPPAIELAKKLAEITPGKLGVSFMVCDGSESVESALKIAKQYHYYRGDKKRFKIISRRNAYHGATMGALSATGAVSPMREIMEPVVPGTVFIGPPYCYRCPWRKEYPGCDMDCAKMVEDTIKFESPELIAAFIAEPIMQNPGSIVPPPEYLPMVREICSRYGVLLILDEIITGYGRTGKMFAAEHFGIVPDIMTMAKGLTSGYVPMGAAITTPEIASSIPAFAHLHTYGEHPVACVVALKNIEIIEREGLVENSAKMGLRFQEGLKEIQKDSEIIGDVRGKGLWNAIEFVTDKKTKAPYDPDEVRRLTLNARAKGLICNPMGSAIEFAPPLIIDEQTIDEGLDIMSEVIAEESKR